MAKISGILTDGVGNIINNCTIELYAKRTTNKVLVQTQAFEVAENGSYTMNALPCDYEVKLIINGFPPKKLGTIQVFSDSADGTLNDFLLNPLESEITPEILQQVIDVRNDAKQSEQNAAKSADDARQHASSIDTSNFIKKTDMIGDQRLMPFRRDELPFGWYFRNGDNFLLSSPQGQALNNLSVNYKRDHNITIKTIDDQQYINVPTAFAPDGRGSFERAVNGGSRQVGSWEDDAIRNIYGELIHVFQWHDTNPRGIFRTRSNNGGSGLNNRFASVTCLWSDSDYPEQTIVFDASLGAPTAHENRPINIGMTPVIYLGV
ncbi:prophage tail fiber N-terminal domain-containing protein [Gilliamella sp. Fer1-1]|uniref:prophage tail fiber N-terminal domain-containing protein n=1 Tax=Gilliamella sp. Fer1-1 TaxID=3120240 RepID=UPI0009BDDB46|nr:prophage tail fiber N-terminal domain-containing protein [Gilliamella apicola]